MSEKNAYIINHNFELVFNRFNALQKFIRKQKCVNKKVTWLAIGIGVYIYFNEKRLDEQRKEFDKLKEEIDELKGE